MSQDSRDQDDTGAADDTAGQMSVPDEDLPEDLQSAEDNPLAQPAGDDVPDDVLTQDRTGHDGSSGGPEGA
jgi:hypothetical protein